MKRGNLELVVDNTGKNRGEVRDGDIEIEDGVVKILKTLDRIDEGNLVSLWLECVNLPVPERYNYDTFLRRHFGHFDFFFEKINIGQYQKMHRKLNFFMMLVYLEVMHDMGLPSNDFAVSGRSHFDSALLPWIQLFAARIEDSEVSNDVTTPPLSVSGIGQSAYVGATRIIESA